MANRGGINNNGDMGIFNTDAKAESYAIKNGWFRAGIYYWNPTIPGHRCYDGTAWVWWGYPGGTELVPRTITVRVTGNDITGDGSPAHPFATIRRALDDLKDYIHADITIDVGPGTYLYQTPHLLSPDDLGEFARFNQLTFFDTSKILIVGTTSDYATGLTFTRDATNRFLYTITPDPGWVADVLLGKFGGKSSSMFPIFENTGDTLKMAEEWTSPATWNTIYDLETILTVVGKNAISELWSNGEGRVEFWNIRFDTNHQNKPKYYGNVTFNFLQCHWNCSGANKRPLLVSGENNHHKINRCLITCNISSIADSQGCIQARNGNIKECVLINNGIPTTAYWSGLWIDQDTEIVAEFVIVNVPFGFGLAGSKIFCAGSLYIKDCGCVGKIYTEGGTLDIATPWKVWLENTDYAFMSRYADRKIDFVLDNDIVDGTPLTAWRISNIVNGIWAAYGLSLQMSTIDPTVNIDLLRELTLYFPDEFAEFDLGLKETLLANAVTTFNIGNYTITQGIVIDYSLIRGAIFEEGQLRINHDNVNVFVVATHTQVTPGASGVSFAGKLNGNIIELDATVDNASINDVEFRYNVQRTNHD